jgi:hypothetical protein
MSASRTGPAVVAAGTLRLAGPRGSFWTGASANVFHASQPGQRPTQRVDSNPHALQKKALFALATLS